MDDVTLSEIGMQRRQEILRLAKGAARRRRGKQSTGRGLGVFFLFAVMGLAAWSLTRLQPIPISRQTQVVQVKSSPVISMPDNTIQYLMTDPTITDRLTIKPEPPRWTTVTDSELLQELADAGKPTGIVCMNGRTILLPRNQPQ